MVKYECLNVAQVRRKIMELTNTGEMGQHEKDYWKNGCHNIRGNGKSNNFDTVDYVDSEGRDVLIFIGWDAEKQVYLIGIEEDQ